MFLSGDGRRVEKSGNPYRDRKSGKFTFGPGGSEKLGERQGFTLLRREDTGSRSADHPFSGRTIEVFQSKDAHRSVVIFEGDGAKLSSSDKEKIMDAVNECQATARIDGAEVLVSDAPFKLRGYAEDEVGGFVTNSPELDHRPINNVIHVNPAVVRAGSGYATDNSRKPSYIPDWFIPEAKGKEPLYIVAHEYGHVHHNLRLREDELRALQVDSREWVSSDAHPYRDPLRTALRNTSGYGRTSGTELYAETFARFVMQSSAGRQAESGYRQRTLFGQGSRPRAPKDVDFTPDVDVFMSGDLGLYGQWRLGERVGEFKRTGTMTVDEALQARDPIVYWR